MLGISVILHPVILRPYSTPKIICGGATLGNYLLG
ncbi:hypothetical protein Alsa3_CDS0138 [Staphylococcus phage Alsa_3]|nr:hypothetical protein Alsa3_CDS0138 [Staphylococcus phage Alsa_3]WNM51263.1 hypothetical protein Alsa4_CDS0133 [Staphylococcus phage Alsa_4]